MGLALDRHRGKVKVDQASRKTPGKPNLNAAEAMEAAENGTVLPELGIAGMLRCRVRYFSDGAVIGGKAFVNEVFASARERFPEKRKDGARRLRGNGAPAAGELWSMRDLRKAIT
jgi:hypothetical protein